MQGLKLHCPVEEKLCQKHTRSYIANGIQAIAVKGGACSDGEADGDEEEVAMSVVFLGLLI